LHARRDLAARTSSSTRTGDHKYFAMRRETRLQVLRATSRDP